MGAPNRLWKSEGGDNTGFWPAKQAILYKYVGVILGVGRVLGFIV